MGREFDGFFIIKQIEKPWLLCSVVKLLRSGQSTQEVGSKTQLRLVFLPTLLSCYSRYLLALQQNRAKTRPLNLKGWSKYANLNKTLNLEFFEKTSSEICATFDDRWSDFTRNALDRCYRDCVFISLWKILYLP